MEIRERYLTGSVLLVGYVYTCKGREIFTVEMAILMDGCKENEVNEKDSIFTWKFRTDKKKQFDQADGLIRFDRWSTSSNGGSWSIKRSRPWRNSRMRVPLCYRRDRFRLELKGGSWKRFRASNSHFPTH